MYYEDTALVSHSWPFLSANITALVSSPPLGHGFHYFNIFPVEMDGFHCNLFVLAFLDGVIISELKALLSYSQPGNDIPKAGIIWNSILVPILRRFMIPFPSWTTGLECMTPSIGSTARVSFFLMIEDNGEKVSFPVGQNSSLKFSLWSAHWP